VGICASLKLCARKKHLWVIEHLCLETPQKKATAAIIFRYVLLQNQRQPDDRLFRQSRLEIAGQMKNSDTFVKK